jgi:alkylresorcinol/alkylpyrone synthase
LATAKLQPEDVDAVLISTCTGYLCPGLTSYVSEQLGLRADVLPLDLVGQGCGAALPNWRMAESLLASGQSRHVLSICVEICSAAFYLDNDPGVLISACLFGDGAAATVLSRQPASHFRRVECVAFQSCLRPNERDSLRFEQRGGMLRNVLSRKVPLLAARQVAKLFQDMMEGRALNRSDVSSWILHAGGRDVLAAVQGHLGLSPDDVQGSAAILRDFGNVSSPFVIFVLAQALCDASPGGWWWMSSFGAGFSCHGALLKVE